MTTYAVLIPDEVILTSIHRLAPAEPGESYRWSVSVQPHPSTEHAYFASGHGVHVELQPAADEAVANLNKNLQDIEPWIARNRAAREATLALTANLELDL